MTNLTVTIAGVTFDARFEEEAAPKTVAAFRARMPFIGQVVHVRWSGEGVWIPLGETDFGVGYENHTSYPAPGQIIPDADEDLFSEDEAAQFHMDFLDGEDPDA